jgi:RNA polymerase sigma factor (sigma-70 family)
MSDAELLELFAERRDELAFAELVRRHGPMVLGICRRTLHNAADAEDAFQATFLALASKAQSIRKPHLLGHWLFGVASRIARAARRQSSRRQLAEKQVMPKQTEAASAADAAADAELVGMLDNEISRLSEKLRQVVVLCYLQGKTKREAAEQLGWPEGTVATRLSQARDILRRRLSAKGIAISSAALSSALSSALAPAAVPPMLVSSTAKAATLFAAGKLTVAGAASAKAAGLAKAFSNAMLAIKIKIAALVIVGCSLMLATAAALSQSKPQPAQAAAPVPQNDPSPKRTEADIATSRTLGVVNAIGIYQQRHQWHYPPDLGATLPYYPWPKEKAIGYIMPADEKGLEIPGNPTPQWVNEHTSFIYFGNANLTDEQLRRFKGSSPRIIICQKPNPASRRPIAVGFNESAAGWLPPAQAKELVGEMLDGLAALGPTTAPIDQVASAMLASFPPDIIPDLPEPHIPDPPLTFPAELRTALEKNAAALGPISISWNVRGYSTSTLQQAIDEYFVEGAESSVLVNWAHHVEFQPGGVHSVSISPKNDVHEDAISDQGAAFTNYQPKPGLLKRRVNTRPLAQVLKNSPNAPQVSDEFLTNAGWRLPSTAGDFAAGIAQSRILWMLSHDAVLAAVGDTTLDGRKMTRVELIAENPDRYQLKKLPRKLTYVFFLDPQMNHAVRRVEQRYGSQLTYVMRNEEFVKLSGRDVWLPHKSYTDFYTFYRIPDQFFDHPILTQERAVTKIDLNEMPHERFVLSPEIPPPEQLQFASAVTEAPAEEARPAVTASVTRARASQGASWLTGPFAVIGALVGLLLLAVLGRVALRRMSERGR